MWFTAMTSSPTNKAKNINWITKGRIRRSLAFGVSLAATMLAAAYLSVPTAAITPADGQSGIVLGTPVEIHSSPLASIGKFEVYADGRLVGMGFNLGSADLVRDFDLKPGQRIQIKTKVASIIGITREFVSNFTTVTPVTVDAINVDGSKLMPGQQISPHPTFTFSFNKPVSTASVSLDGAGPIKLQVSRENPSTAVLPPNVSLKQGAVHLFKLTATGTDSSTLLQPEAINVLVVKPLSLYGRVNETGGQTETELDASVAFRNPAAVSRSITTDIPGASIAVKKQKIIITGTTLNTSASYNITVGAAEGVDQSFLEGPLSLTVAFHANQSAAAAGGSETTYRGYVYTGSGSAGQPRPAAGAPAESGPPPGWPPCCPWPPRR